MDRRLMTSESVTEGHPDKNVRSDSDAVLDAIIREDKDARVACETCMTTGLILIKGEITTSTYVPLADRPGRWCWHRVQQLQGGL